MDNESAFIIDSYDVGPFIFDPAPESPFVVASYPVPFDIDQARDQTVEAAAEVAGYLDGLTYIAIPNLLRPALLYTTAVLAPGATVDFSLEAFPTFMIRSIEVSAPCWVRFYTNTPSRDADAARLPEADPSLGAGVLLEVLANNAGVYPVNPVVPVITNYPAEAFPLYCRVTSRASVPAAIAIIVNTVSMGV